MSNIVHLKKLFKAYKWVGFCFICFYFFALVSSNDAVYASNTVDLPAVADVYVDSSKSYNDQSLLNVKATIRKAYLKFDVSSLQNKRIVSATLNLRLVGPPTNGALRTATLFPISDDTWDETTSMTYITAPVPSGVAIATFAVPTASYTPVQAVITDYIASQTADGAASIQIDDTGTFDNANGAFNFACRTHATTSWQPKLTVVYDDIAPVTDYAITNREFKKAGNTITNISAGSITGNVYVANNTSADKNVVLILALYNNGMLESYNIVPGTILANKSNNLITGTMDVSSISNRELAMFVWENTTNMIPIGSSYSIK